jgi:hypothetical protein
MDRTVTTFASPIPPPLGSFPALVPVAPAQHFLRDQCRHAGEQRRIDPVVVPQVEDLGPAGNLRAGQNETASTSRICPSTDPRAPACPGAGAIPRPPRQPRADRTPSPQAPPPSASALPRSTRRPGATRIASPPPVRRRAAAGRLRRHGCPLHPRTGGADARTFQPIDVNLGLFSPPPDVAARGARSGTVGTRIGRRRISRGGWMRNVAK